MSWRSIAARALVPLLIIAVSSLAAAAGEIAAGARAEVKANSIWFQEADKLARWQQLRASGSAADLDAYQNEALASRDAWQFVNRLDVKILAFDRARSQVSVEMTSQGRLQGSTWMLDADALVR